MIKSIIVTNYLNESLTLTLARPEESGFLVNKIEGLGPPKATVNTKEVSTNDGSQFNSARIGDRNIVLSLHFQQTETESIEDIRHKSYKYFPIKKQVTLTIVTDNRTSKAVGIVETNKPNIFEKQENTQISIVCPDPYLYSAGDKEYNNTIFYGIEPLFHFPFCNPSTTEKKINFSAIKNLTENVVTYTGDADIGVVITIHAIGPATNITIYNTGTREFMTINTSKILALTGSGLVAGDEIVITTIRGEKGIILLRGGHTTNILNCIAKNSSWFTLAKGDNLFAYTAESGSSNLQFRIKNKILFEGA